MESPISPEIARENSELISAVKEAEEKCLKFYTDTLKKFLGVETQSLLAIRKESHDLEEETVNLFCVLLHEKGQVIEESLRSELESGLKVKLEEKLKELAPALFKSPSTSPAIVEESSPKINNISTEKSLAAEINIFEKYIRKTFTLEVDQLDDEGKLLPDRILYEWTSWRLDNDPPQSTELNNNEMKSTSSASKL